ncbi:helix-turn-helix domain-containing protein [Amycolatopsis sp. NPDC051372]|uniref:winged helix-turn-helix transcriptional regulator n=1 Tax=unclassified Amycolatopsis TaxID=2618356 RepID=UPI00343DD626
MLSQRLTTLTDAGLVRRTVFEGPPVAVSYELTAPGKALIPVLGDLSQWAEEHLPG